MIDLLNSAFPSVTILAALVVSQRHLSAVTADAYAAALQGASTELPRSEFDRLRADALAELDEADRKMGVAA